MNQQKKYLFIDRDGTLIEESEDKQIDCLTKLRLMPGVISALTELKKNGFTFIMVSNQDGLGTASFPEADFKLPHDFMLNIFHSQNINFEDILICPHKPEDNCQCRKPQLGLVLDYLREQKIDRINSYVIGDRDTDVELAANMGIKGIKIEDTNPWETISRTIIDKPRVATVNRKTNETDITISLNIDNQDNISVKTGIDFYDHMLEQLIKHAGFSGNITVNGDLNIDDHHTVEDTALALGEAIKSAVGDKIGIKRYGFTLPMDEAATTVSLDLSGRPYCRFVADFKRDKVGKLSTEMIGHFYHSLANSLGATIHIEIIGDNCHHMAESSFKALGQALALATKRVGSELPSTKGVL
jgi:imidazoleglycerol-phosphate dehydratase/histidinol-phosphatase